jgi:hypothetical protein
MLLGLGISLLCSKLGRSNPSLYSHSEEKLYVMRVVVPNFFLIILMLLGVKNNMYILKYIHYFHTYTQVYIVQTQQNIQFYSLYIQTRIEIGCHLMILTPH